MSDWNELKRLFRKALIDAYNWSRLRSVLTYHGNRRLDLITSENAGFIKNVDDVLAAAEQNGWLEELALGALAENETHSGLQATVPLILEGIAAEGKAYYQRLLSGSAGTGGAHDAGISVGNLPNAMGVAIGEGATSVVVLQVGGQNPMPAGSQQAAQQVQSLLDPDMLRSLLGDPELKAKRLPKMADIFDIIDDPDQVASAFFPERSGQRLSPNEVGYVMGREGEDNLQEALTEALMDAGGILLLQSRAGLGKTREVAELALNYCRLGWMVCIAVSKGDKALDRLAGYPNDLHGRRLLLIFDDLHLRTGSSDDDQAPYTERLEAFLDYMSQQIDPRSLLVLATAPSEPGQIRQLGFDRDVPPWRRFDVYELPEFSIGDLERKLAELAQQMEMTLDKDEVGQLVGSSDKTLNTLVENINNASRNNQPLSLENWLPTPGYSWNMLYSRARKSYPLEVSAVYGALYLIREAGLATRTAYIARLSALLIGADVQPAVDKLFDMGLLGKRGDVLDAFSHEHLIDSLQRSGGALPALSDNWDNVIEAVTTVSERPDEWLSDLVTLTDRLNGAKQFKQSIAVAGTAIEQGANGAEIFYNRALAHSECSDFAGAEQDFTTAMERGQDDAAIYLFRGGNRFSTADYAGAEEDLTAAIERGAAYAMVFAGRGAARALAGDYAGAETDLNAAISLGQDSTELYLARGAARFYGEEYAGAVEDFTVAIERGMDGAELYLLRAAATIQNGSRDGLEEDLAAAIERDQDQPWAFFLRGSARYDIGDFEGAQTDLTAAIERGYNDAYAFLQRGDAHFNSGDYAGAEADYTAAIEHGWDKAPVYFFRGRARTMNSDHTGAEADYTAAIERGQDDAFVFVLRGDARANNADQAGAEADYTAAIERGWDEAPLFFYRGLARFRVGNHAGAEADASAAVERGQDDAAVYALRGDARRNNEDYSGAQADYSAAIERGQDDASIYYYRGRARSGKGDHAGAETDYTTAIEHGQDDADVYFWRATSRGALNDLSGSLMDYSAAIKRGGEDALNYYGRGMVNATLGDAAGAEADFSAAIEHGQDDASVFYWRGRSRLEINDPIGAEADLTVAIERGQDDADVYYWRGRSRLENQALDGAELDMTAAVERGRDDGDVYKYRGWARVGNGEFAGAEDDLTLAIVRGEDGAFVYFLRAGARSENGNYAGSEADYTAAIEQNPDYADTYYQRGLVKYRVADFSGAEADFATAIKLGQDNADTNSMLGLARRYLGQWPEAVESYRQAVELDPSRNLDWMGLAASARMAGDDAGWQEAVEKARPLVDWNDFYNAACFASVAGEIDRALELLRQALQEQPELADQARTDPDLHWVWEDPRFAQLIEEASSKQP